MRPALPAFALLIMLTSCTGPEQTAMSSPAPSTQPASVPAADTAGPACSLSPEQLNARRHELIPGLFKRAEQVTDVPNGLRFRFASKPALLADLARVADREQDCCSFLRFTIMTEPHAGPVTFEVTGPPGTADMLRKL